MLSPVEVMNMLPLDRLRLPVEMLTAPPIATLPPNEALLATTNAVPPLSSVKTPDMVPPERNKVG